MAEHPALGEQLPDAVGHPSPEDGLRAHRVDDLVGAGVGQHAGELVLDHDRGVAERGGEGVGEGEQVGRAPARLGLAALEDQPVGQPGEVAPGDLGVGQHDGDARVLGRRGDRGFERRRGADEHRGRARLRRQADGLRRRSTPTARKTSPVAGADRSGRARPGSAA